MEILDPADRLAPVKNAEITARLYRRLVLLVGMQILVGIARVPRVLLQGSSTVAPLILVVFILVGLGVYVATAVTAYQLTRHLGAAQRSSIFWAIAMFIPCINIVALLIISSQAQSWCRQHGIKVGLLGPTRQSIEDLRRRLMSSDFD
jgi:hypothetical protein